MLYIQRHITGTVRMSKEYEKNPGPKIQCLVWIVLRKGLGIDNDGLHFHVLEVAHH